MEHISYTATATVTPPHLSTGLGIWQPLTHSLVELAVNLGPFELDPRGVTVIRTKQAKHGMVDECLREYVTIEQTRACMREWERFDRFVIQVTTGALRLYTVRCAFCNSVRT